MPLETRTGVWPFSRQTPGPSNSRMAVIIIHNVQRNISMDEIKDYPSLVDAIWKIVQGTAEDQDRLEATFSEEQIAEALNVPYSLNSEACSFGIARANWDLVSLKFFEGRGGIPDRYQFVSRSLGAPRMLPSAYINPPPLENLPTPLAQKALILFHEQSIRHEDGITFYGPVVRIQREHAIRTLMPDSADMHTARNQMQRAIQYLEEYGFVTGFTTTGHFAYRPTLRGAGCLKCRSSFGTSNVI